jgi:hypothetical protein
MSPIGDKSSNVRVILALIFLASVGAFYFFAASSPSFVFGSRYAYRPGPDADGKVEITLLYSKKPNNQSPLQWNLRIPHRFVNSVVGDLRNIGPKGFASLNLNGRIEPVTGAFLSASGNDRYGADAIYLHLDNQTTARLKQIPCLSSANDSIELQKADLRVCETKNCSIYDVIDGWNAQYIVPRYLALDPEPLCKTFRTFLNSHTIKRDNILDEEQ